jgi:DNA-binding MarR family transcriptional regulator
MNSLKEEQEALHQQLKEKDSIYHDAAVAFGLSDTAFLILYVLTDSERDYTQLDIANEWSLPTQTVNTAVKGLIKQGYVTLETIPNTRNRKKISLTKKARSFIENELIHLYESEQKALLRLTPQEREAYIELGRKYLFFFREETEKAITAAQVKNK